MKPLRWDSVDPDTGLPYPFDSPIPHLTWDGIRDPGEPGYLPPSPPTSSIQTKKRTAFQDHE